MIEIISYKKCEVDSDIVTDFTLDIPRENFDFSKGPFGFMGWIVGKNFQFDPTKSIGRFKRELSPDILRLCN